MLALLESLGLNSIFAWIKIGAIVVALGAAITFYYNWKSSVQEAAIYKFKAIQTEEILKAKQTETDSLKAEIDILHNVEAEKAKQIEEFQNKLDEISKQIDNTNVDNKASKLLQDTIDGLRKARNQ